MRVLIKTLLLLFPACVIAQTFPAPLQVRRIYNITSSTTCIDNRSQTSGQMNYSAFIASGSGSWSVQMQYSDVSCSGPWTSYGAAALVTQASNPAIGYGNDGFNTFHKFISFAITGTPSINYSAAKDFFLSTSVGSVIFPITLAQGGLGTDLSSIAKGGIISGTGPGTVGIKTVGSFGQVLLVDSTQAGGIRWFNNVAVNAALYNFATQSPSGTLTAGVPANVTLSPVPWGLNGTDTFHWIYLSTCSGGPHAVSITGGTAVSGASSGTITFIPTNSCNAGFTVAPATGGIQEAIIDNPQRKVKYPRTLINAYAPINLLDTTVSYDINGDIDDESSGSGGSTVINNLQVNGNNGVSITACTNANPTVCTSTHGFPANSHPQLEIAGATAAGWLSLNSSFMATILSPTTFSLPFNAISAGALAGTVTFSNGHTFVRDGNSANRITSIHDLRIVGTGSAGNGIYVRGTAGVRLERLTITGFTSGYAIYCNQCFHGFIQNNLVNGNIHGIGIDTSNNITVRENAITGNSGFGITITGGVGTEATDNRVEDNDAESNNRWMTATNAWRTYVTGNYVEGNISPGYFGSDTIGVVYNGNYHLGPGVQFDGTDAVEACGNTFQGTTSHLDITSGSRTYNICKDNVFNLGSLTFPAGASFDAAAITAATTTTLPQTGDWFDIAVGAGITSITPSWAGRTVDLHFQGATTVFNGNNLKLRANFVATTDSTLTLKADNVNWFEMGRSIPGGSGLSIPFTIGSPGGSALSVAATTTDYFVVPFTCTISAYNLLIDAGTITVKFWKVATGTAIPTSGNSINTSGVGISAGTAIHSTTLSDFTTTTVAANDMMAMNVTAVATAKYVKGVLECDQ